MRSVRGVRIAASRLGGDAAGTGGMHGAATGEGTAVACSWKWGTVGSGSLSLDDSVSRIRRIASSVEDAPAGATEDGRKRLGTKAGMFDMDPNR